MSDQSDPQPLPPLLPCIPAMDSVLEIPAGDYEIGDDGIPNAGPRHRRSLRRPIWIDAWPVSWAHFEAFVVAGGYQRVELWSTPSGNSVFTRPASVDQRCRLLRQASETCRRAIAPDEPGSCADCLTGINWFEANALARFCGGRLPAEAEWEIAMRDPKKRPPTKRRFETSPWRAYFVNERGCVDTIGAVQEWTEGAYQPNYWRADGHSSVMNAEGDDCSTVRTVRGAAPGDLYRDVGQRVGKRPDDVSAFRGFRRVWAVRPTERQIAGRMN